MAILNNNPLVGASGNQGGYNINNSLRFRSSASAYLSRTPASNGNQQKFTWSGWVKRGTLGSEQAIIVCRTGSSTEFGRLIFNSSDQLDLWVRNSSSTTLLRLVTTQVFRDPSAWYHVVMYVDTTQSTAANRAIFYVNGIQVTAYGTATYPSQNTNLDFNTANLTALGVEVPNATYLDGYMAEVNFIDGSAKTPSDFGETDTTTGVWKPKAYTGTYGTNGFYLKFSDIATTSGSNAGLGKDFSGNSNYFTTNNISVTSGTTYDAMTDSPTNTSATVANYPVMNPLNNAAVLSAGNLNATGTGASWASVSGTIGISSGKYYWEITAGTINNSGAYGVVGIGTSSASTTQTYTNPTTVWVYDGRGTKQGNGSGDAGFGTVTYGASYTSGDVIGVALDMDNGTLTFYKNNTSQGVAFNSGLSGLTVFPWIGVYGSTAVLNANFGQRPFSYTPPTGFVALNTFNLPDSTIKKGNSYMDATLYTGSTGSVTVTNAAGFKPDMVWMKARSGGVTNHALVDSVRPSGYALYPNITDAEANNSTLFTGITSTGFTLAGNNATYSGNGYTYVGWQWQAGQGSTSSNTSGSITSTVSVNTTAGFSVVTFNTGTIASSATVGHGLGVAPKMIILKTRAITGTWVTYHADVGNTKYLELNNTMAAATASSIWNNTSPTSSVFTIGSGFNNQGNYVAYCWAEIAGFSKFGSYTGNGSTDGPFVYTGFRPKFVMWKKSNAAESWVIIDTSRDPVNLAFNKLYANGTSGDDTGTTYGVIDALSNGFKIRSSHTVQNNNGDTYIYMAFAENPFKNSLAR